jgi:hypothetical protein
MVSFAHHIVFSAETRVYIGLLIFFLFLYFLAVSFVGMMIYQLIIAIETQSEMLGVYNRAQAKKVERKKE